MLFNCYIVDLFMVNSFECTKNSGDAANLLI